MLQLIERDGDLAVAALADDVDFYTSSDLRTAGFDLLDDGCRYLVLDTSSLDFIDSSGITALLALWQRLDAADGALVLAVPDEGLRRRMDVLGLDTVLTITPALAQAVTRARRIRAGARSPGGRPAPPAASESA
ncbi:STAS domain-containing protein [Streptomyces dubilierae]|uniref:STAS domain-containing protein n=1 Tax=Streptomyces dubilierae TaxID=3075533 RepID=A0ABU2PI90_9ACTN|nr:STAS domain-containing protein [Streptomyces sp. DSM 41921]MDT0391055.1 STAS domain-containing protein [Streptomyces sp. DSM 41921]